MSTGFDLLVCAAGYAVVQGRFFRRDACGRLRRIFGRVPLFYFLRSHRLLRVFLSFSYPSGAHGLFVCFA